MSEAKMREEFEAKYVGAYLDKHEGLYADPAIRELWGCWQASRAQADAEFAKEREQLHETANKWLAKCDELDSEREQLCVEIEKYRMVATDNKDWFDQTKEEFDKRGALIAMQAEALGFAQLGSCYCLTKTNEPSYHSPQCPYRRCAEAISASAESVAAWEAEKLEPLRRKVAMLTNMFQSVWSVIPKEVYFGKATIDSANAKLANTQEFTEAF